MSFGVAAYPSDDGNTYNLRMSNLTYTATTLASGGEEGALYPKHWHPRVVHGLSTTGHKKSIPVAISNALWTGSINSFTYNGTEYVATGRTGEKRPNLAPPFA